MKFLLTIVVFLTLSKLCQADSIRVVVNMPMESSKPLNQCKSQICKILLSNIQSAKRTIDFAIYGLRRQDKILSALINAEKRGVAVRGIVDKDIDNKNYYTDTHLIDKNLKNIKSDHKIDLRTDEYLKRKYKNLKKKWKKGKCKRPLGTKGPLQCFEGKGYASIEEIIFKGDLMHNKFFIFDKRYVWTGSANISDTGTGGYNANIIAFFDSKFLAKYYSTEFNQMFINGKYHRKKNKLRKKKIETFIENENVNIFFSPQGFAMQRGVIPLIRSAKNTIHVSIFFLTHNSLSKELVKAQKRGVDVRIILDATGASNGYSKHKYLREHGIKLKVENWGGKMHMKSAVIDRKHIIVGSMNWTKAGDTKNDENTIIIKNAESKAKNWIRKYNVMWNSIPEKWLTSDPKPESLDSGSSCYDGTDNDFDNVIDQDEIECN